MDGQYVMMTHLCLVDGDGHQTHTRLVVNTVPHGRMLVNGDIVCLDIFSELRYGVNKESQKMPAPFVTVFKTVGYICHEENDVNELLPCVRVLPNDHNDDLKPSGSCVVDPRVHDKLTCTNKNSICAINGQRFAGCICEIMPVENLNMQQLSRTATLPRITWR